MVISQKFIPYLLNRKAYFRYQIEILNHSLNTSIIYIALIAFENQAVVAHALRNQSQEGPGVCS